MEVRPILASMRRSKLGAALIAIQVALTLAILSNAVFIIRQQVALAKRPSGVDEVNIFVITNEWVGNPSDLAARTAADLSALRAIPDAIDAYSSNSYPLSNSGSTSQIGLRPDERDPRDTAAIYFADEHTLRTLGSKLVAGRNFYASEVTSFDGEHLGHGRQAGHAGAVIVSRALARQLFPGRDALGRLIYLGLPQPQRIIGVVDTLQAPWTSGSGWGSTFDQNSILVPVRPIEVYADYIVRVRPGKLAAVMSMAQNKLFSLSRSRILSNVRALSEARKQAYRDERGYAIILSIVCLVMLAITGLGIVGLTSYWVSRRQGQIGIRRALGGTRGAIVRYFQTENLLIAAVGIATGVVLGLGTNLWMVEEFAMSRLPAIYLPTGAIIVLGLGQLAVLWPALRAASVPPAVAARSI